MISETKLEKYLLENINYLINEKATNVDIELENQKDNESKIKSIKNKMKKLADLYMDDMVELDYYNVEYTRLKKSLEIEQSKKILKKDNTKKIEETKKLLNNDFFKIYSTLSENQKRIIWGKVFNYLVIDIKNRNEFNIELIID